MLRIFTAQVRPPAILIAFRCEVCKLTNAASMPSKASYGEADVQAVAHLVARLAAKPCGCAP